MIRLELNWLRLLQRLRGPGRGAHERFLMMNLGELDPLPLSPGWFDSSWELEHGLEVREDVKLDAAQQARLEDAMIASALARLRAAAARVAKPASAAPKGNEEPAAPAPSKLASVPAARRECNLIEFDAGDLGDWQLQPPRRSMTGKGVPEFELAPA